MAVSPRNRNSMGLGVLGSERLHFKRKFRWTLSINTRCGAIPEEYVKLAARPNISIEETEINFLHQKTWIPGKAAWETITVTYYDVAGTPDAANQNGGDSSIIALYNWLASVYDFTNATTIKMNSSRAGYAGVATLMLYDGCGTAVEGWQLLDAWPQAINFGELDYASSEEVTIEMTLRYSAVDFSHFCPNRNIGCDCLPCA